MRRLGKLLIKYDKDREEVEVGCIYAENCFECPFDDCVCATNDMELCGAELDRRRKEVLDTAKRIKALVDGGMKLSKVAGEMEWPTRIVKRYLIIAKREEEKDAKQAGPGTS